jgi:uncharacterized LabA/DUF88 family protein
MHTDTPALLRVMVFVDGFNLYHSIERAQRLEPSLSLKWLDLSGLLTAHLYMISTAARLAGVHYFTAYADHLAPTNPDKVARHRAYVRALTASGVLAHFGHFKSKDTWIETAQAYHRIWQEKATDVGIVAEMFLQAHQDTFDIAVIVSGDADYAPAIPVFKALHPQKRLVFAFPYDRKNKELDRLAAGSFTLGRESYAAHQFPTSVRLPSGKFVVCPHVWRTPPPPPPSSAP